MKQISIPLNGLVSKPDPPASKVGTLSECTNWLKWKNMLQQAPGSLLFGNSTGAHSAIWHRASDSNAYLVFTDGRDVKKIDAGNNAVSTITANEFASANINTLRWPIDRFTQHIFMGSHHDGLHWYFPEGYNGTVTGKAGVTAPANAATATAGNANGITGVYQLVYTFVNSQNHESAPSPASDSICVADHGIVWSNIEAGPAGTISRKLYRTVNDGALFLYLDTIADNTTTTYDEDTTSDTSLGSEVDFEGSDVPPSIIRGMAVAGSRLYLLDENSVIWACKIDPQTSLPNWEAYPSKLSTKIPAGESSDNVQNIFALSVPGTGVTESVFAATRSRTFKLVGDPYTGTQVVKSSNIGLYNRWSWCYVDFDRTAAFMLTSNFKVVKLYADGHWDELGEDIITILQSITNNKAPDLGDSVDMSYDPRLNLIMLHCAISGASNNSTLILDLNTGKWSQASYGYLLSLVDDSATKYIGYEKGVRFVLHSTSLFTKVGSYFTTQRFATYPFFIPDKQLQVGRIGIVCRALPIVSNIPPMLYVEYAINNNAKWVGRYVDVSNVPRRRGGVGTALVAQEAITAFVPVHSTVESISVRITAPQNAAAVQGFEIYDIYLEVDEAEESQAEGRDIDRDAR